MKSTVVYSFKFLLGAESLKPKNKRERTIQTVDFDFSGFGNAYDHDRCLLSSFIVNVSVGIVNLDTLLRNVALVFLPIFL